MPTTKAKRRRDTVAQFDALISLRLAGQDLQQLDALCDRLERSRASLVREAVSDYLQSKTGGAR